MFELPENFLCNVASIKAFEKLSFSFSNRKVQTAETHKSLQSMSTAPNVMIPVPDTDGLHQKMHNNSLLWYYTSCINFMMTKSKKSLYQQILERIKNISAEIVFLKFEYLITYNIYTNNINRKWNGWKLAQELLVTFQYLSSSWQVFLIQKI